MTTRATPAQIYVLSTDVPAGAACQDSGVPDNPGAGIRNAGPAQRTIPVQETQAPILSGDPGR
jgi:hypothetical protein